MTSHESALAQEVRSAVERTVRRGSARIRFVFEVSLTGAFEPEASSIAPRDGSIGARFSERVSDGAGRLLVTGLEFAIRRVSKPMARGAPGVIDFGAHRCVYYPTEGKAEMVVGDRSWYGAPGTPIEMLSATAALEFQPLWLIDIVRGVVDAREQAPQQIDGRGTRRLRVYADLDRASAAVEHHMAMPTELDSGDRTHIALDVWIDDAGSVRRVRRATSARGHGTSTSTLDLTELGIGLPSDWTVIPTA